MKNLVALALIVLSALAPASFGQTTDSNLVGAVTRRDRRRDPKRDRRDSERGYRGENDDEIRCRRPVPVKQYSGWLVQHYGYGERLCDVEPQGCQP